MAEESEPAADARKQKRPREWLERIEHNWIEIAAAALMALATIMSAVSAYQSSRYNGLQSIHFSDSDQAMTKATQYSDKANQQLSVDISMASDYMTATMQGDVRLAQFFKEVTFSKELTKAIAAWDQAKAVQGASAPRTPFDMPEYKLDLAERSLKMQKISLEEAGKAKQDINHANAYLLLTVIFAGVLFFAGISTKFNGQALKVAVLGFGIVVFLTGLVITVIIP